MLVYLFIALLIPWGLLNFFYSLFRLFRFEHREENRKDCLRTLFALIEEAGKANKMVDETRTTYVKNRLRANPAFMVRLLAKTKRLQESKTLNA